MLYEELSDEWKEWLDLTPIERFRQSEKIFAQYLAMGGSLDPDPDPTSPFYDPNEVNDNERPASQRTERKLRKYGGMLCNLQAVLCNHGFDRQEAEDWWYEQWQRLESLTIEAAGDGKRSLELHSAEEHVERHLHPRMDSLVRFLNIHAPELPQLPAYRLYLTKWQEVLGA